MTNSAPRPTAREQLAAVAAEHGWTETVNGSTTLRVQRGDERVTVTFKRGGSVHYAEICTETDAAVTRDYVQPQDVDKRRKVYDRLAADPQANVECAQCGSPKSSNRHAFTDGHAFVAPADGPGVVEDETGTRDELARTPIIGRVVAAEPHSRALANGDDVVEPIDGHRGDADPADIPTVDQVADAIEAGTWGGAPVVIPVVHLESGATFARPADGPQGTYATLDEAEAGQPRASVERLRELAFGLIPASHVGPIARDHARIVLARLDELEAQAQDTPMGAGTPYDNLLKDWSAQRDRIAELEADRALARARVVHLTAEASRYAHRIGTLRTEIYAALQNIAPDSTGVIPTDDQLVRDVADLRAERDRAVHEIRQLWSQKDALVVERDQARTRVAELQREHEDLYDPPAMPGEESDEDDERQAEAERLWAHIVTSEAQALGDPGVVIMRDGEHVIGVESDPVAEYPLPAELVAVDDVVHWLSLKGWQATDLLETWTSVDTGYWIVQVEQS